jgi:hypothetical protein
MHSTIRELPVKPAPVRHVVLVSNDRGKPPATVPADNPLEAETFIAVMELIGWTKRVLGPVVVMTEPPDAPPMPGAGRRYPQW